MAYTNNTNFYNSAISNEYANSITGQIQRIEDAHDAIRSKAIELGLKIPGEAKLTANKDNAEEMLLQAKHQILDTAAAINNIPMNNHGDTTLTPDVATYTVPVGYNAIPYTVSFDLTKVSGTADVLDVLVGKTFYKDGQLVTGQMADIGHIEATAFGSHKPEDSETSKLYLTIPQTGKYTAGNRLESDINYYAGTSVEIPVEIKHNELGETIVDSSQAVKKFPEGYYTGLNITAVFTNDPTNKVINVANTVGTLTKGGVLQVEEGFDYIAPGIPYQIQEGTVEDGSYVVNPDSGQVEFTGCKVATAGWLDVAKEEELRKIQYTPVKAKFSVNAANGLTTVETAGWVLAGTELGGLNSSEVKFEGPAKADTNLSIDNTVILENEYYVRLQANPGYVPQIDKVINLGVAKTTSQASTEKANAQQVTSQHWSVVTSEGYNPTTTVTELTVKDGSVSSVLGTNSKGQCVVQVTEGWVSTGTVVLDTKAVDATFELTETYLSSVNDASESEFVIQAPEKALMASLSVDTSYLFNRLASI
jgi:hypothetical protein